MREVLPAFFDELRKHARVRPIGGDESVKKDIDKSIDSEVRKEALKAKRRK